MIRSPGAGHRPIVVCVLYSIGSPASRKSVRETSKLMSRKDFIVKDCMNVID
jgi:hypothetical protein